MNGKASKKQERVILPILLWLVPLLSLNIGFYFLAEIDLYWQNAEQATIAAQETEGIASAAEFSYQFAKTCGNFSNIMNSAVEAGLSQKQLITHLRDRARRVFRSPFPEKELYVFEIPEETRKCKMLMSDAKKAVSKRAFERIFDYLVKLNLGTEMPDFIKKQNEKLLTTLLGGETSGSMLAYSQRAKASNAIYDKNAYWLNWDYFKIPGKGIYGHIVLSKCLEQNRFDGMLLALRDFRDRRIGLSAFIPLFKGYGNSVLQAPLHRSKLFKNWVRTQITPVEDNLKQWLANGPPPSKDLGNFRIYSYLGKGNTHLTTLALPKPQVKPVPIWIRMLNILVISLVLIFLLRGFLLQCWPRIRLKLRFQVIFLLTATLPLSLLLISSSSYITQYRRSLHFQTVSNLLMSIKQFDSRKAQVEDTYKSSFVNLMKDRQFQEALAREGSYSKSAEKILLKSFDEAKKPLPTMCYAFFDEAAEGLRGYGKGNKDQLQAFIDSFTYPIVGSLRRHIIKARPEVKLKDYSPTEVQELTTQAYTSVTSLDLIEELGKRRLFPLARQRGDSLSTQIHDFVQVDGYEKYAVLLAWDDDALDGQTIKQTTDFLAINNPEFSFIHFKASQQNLKPAFEISRHVPLSAIPEARKLAETVFFKGSSSSTQTPEFSIVAFPSARYPGMIIVGISRNFFIEAAVFNRLLYLGIIVALAILLVLFIAWLSARIVLSPITDLKNSLDQISQGNLDASISQESQDELGLLAQEFSQMTYGLRERSRLAALLSDHAIEALSKSHSGEGVLSGETFDGVALVSDIRDFTGMCERFPPDQVTELLNQHFAKMAAAVSSKGGRIYKFIGDAIEAVFPEDSSFDASPELRAFQAAALMNVEHLKLNQQRRKEGLFEYSFGIGLASGRFFSGGTGSLDTRLDYALLGDALKEAARLESLSSANPSFPIITDNRVAQSLKDQAMILSEINGGNAFTMLEISNELVSSDESEKIEGKSQSSLNVDESTQINIESKWNPGPILLAGLILLAGFFLGIDHGLSFMAETGQKIEEVALAEDGLRVAEQIKTEGAARTGFENVCYQTVKELEQSLKFIPDANEEEYIGKNLTKRLQTLAEQGIAINRSACFHFGKVDQNFPEKEFIKVIHKNGWSNEHFKIIEDFARYKHNFDMDLPRDELREQLDHQIPMMLGEAMGLGKFYGEVFGSAVEVTIDGESQFIYTRYLVARSESLIKTDLSKDINKLRIEGKKKDLRLVGIVFFTISPKLMKSPKTILNSYFDRNTALAARRNDSGEFIFSSNFPPDLKESMLKGTLLQAIPGTKVISDSASFADIQYDITVLTGLKNLTRSKAHSGLILILAFILSAIFIARLSYGESLANKSLSGKLWLAMAACSLIPIVTVYFVVQLFEKENFNAQFQQERARLQQFLDSFEQRLSFSEPLAWKTVKNFSFSKELRSAVEEVDRQDSQAADFSPLDREFSLFNLRARELRKTVSNFEPRDAAIVSKRGWEYVNRGNIIPHYDPDADPDTVVQEEVDSNGNQFALLLAKIGKNLISRMRLENDSQKFDADGLKGEMVLKIGLRSVSAMFGENVAIKLANGVGFPVKMGILDASVGLIVHPVNQVFMPDYVIIWMILFKNSTYLRDIADMFRGEYAMFPVTSNLPESLASPFLNFFDFGLSQVNSWVSTSNLPISKIHSHEGKDYLVESRRAIKQISMITTGVKPIEPIVESVSAATNKFWISLLISLILIAVLAKNVSSEILSPIEQLIHGMQEIEKENFAFRIGLNRGDELGDLCLSFDQMAKGLEEKYLMGKMLSQDALSSALEQKESKNEEMVIFYVGSPGFSSWLSVSANPNDLFADLQKQVAEVSRIIIDEGGDIDKIIGEKILAIFRGDPKAASISACKAAQKLLAAENKGFLPFPVSAGISVGRVISGVLGVGDKKDFTVIGDTVNVAARIESLAQTMRYHRILLSNRVFQNLNCEISAREYGSVELKGKTAAEKVFQLEA